MKRKNEFIKHIKQMAENLSEEDKFYTHKLTEDFLIERYKVNDDEAGVIEFTKVNHEVWTVRVNAEYLLELFWESIETVFDDSWNEVALAVLSKNVTEDFYFDIETSNMELEEYFETVKRISEKKAGVSEEC